MVAVVYALCYIKALLCTDFNVNFSFFSRACFFSVTLMSVILTNKHTISGPEVLFQDLRRDELRG